VDEGQVVVAAAAAVAVVAGDAGARRAIIRAINNR